MAGTRFSPACTTALEPPLLSLQLLLQLVEKPPVGALGDELLETALAHPGLVQTHSVEAHRILWVELPPHVVGELLHDLKGSVVAAHVTLVQQELGDPL